MYCTMLQTCFSSAPQVFTRAPARLQPSPQALWQAAQHAGPPERRRRHRRPPAWRGRAPSRARPELAATELVRCVCWIAHSTAASGRTWSCWAADVEGRAVLLCRPVPVARLQGLCPQHVGRAACHRGRTGRQRAALGAMGWDPPCVACVPAGSAAGRLATRPQHVRAILHRMKLVECAGAWMLPRGSPAVQIGRLSPDPMPPAMRHQQPRSSRASTAFSVRPPCGAGNRCPK
jgi:hypothetical protein